jgi:hypothetical protein
MPDSQKNIAAKVVALAHASHRGGAIWKLHLIVSASLAIAAKRASFDQALRFDRRSNNQSGVSHGPAT